MQGSGVLVPAPSSPKLLGSGSRGGPLRTLEGVGHRHARAGTWRLPRREEVRAGRRSLSKGRGSLPRIHGPSPDKPRSSPRERPGKPRHVQRGRGHGNPSAHRPGPRATPVSAAVSAELGVGAADCSPETGWLCSVSRRLRGPGGGGKESVLRKSQALITLLLFECSETARACKSGRGSPSPQTAKLGAHSSPSWEALCPQDGGSRMVSPPTWL